MAKYERYTDKRIKTKIEKIGRKIAMKQRQIDNLRIDCEKTMITDYDFISQKKRIDEKIKALNFKSSILKDELMKRKKHSDEKVMKREDRKRRERKYFEWYKKHENI